MIAIGSDHAGWEIKEKIIKYLEDLGHKVYDTGTNSLDSCDYPVYAKAVAQKVANKEAEFGILVCGTGLGMSMAANKVAGVRAACVENTFSARATRAHNNANVLCLGARVLGESIIFDIIENWLNTPFEGGRHQKRIDMFEHAQTL